MTLPTRLLQQAAMVLLGMMLFPASALAWSAPGHMTIAAIAYRDLDITSRTTVNALLQHHPDYQKWAASYPTNSSLDLPTFIFMRASTWADEIRRKSSQYDHPQWHYVNLPLISPNFPAQPSPSPTNDIVFGITQCEKILKDKAATPEVKAIYLSWLIHLVGDVHQPLHCVALVNENYPAPQGDKGGNDFFVKPNTVGVNLHSVWDRGLGSSVNAREQYNNATEISSAYPRKKLSELLKNKTAESWSIESRQVALESGYLNGKLQGSISATNAPSLPDGYTKSLKQVAEKQAAIAGYRLSAEIRANLDWSITTR